jgi:hypothetical protein
LLRALMADPTAYVIETADALPKPIFAREAALPAYL